MIFLHHTCIKAGQFIARFLPSDPQRIIIGRGGGPKDFFLFFTQKTHVYGSCAVISRLYLRALIYTKSLLAQMDYIREQTGSKELSCRKIVFSLNPSSVLIQIPQQKGGHCHAIEVLNTNQGLITSTLGPSCNIQLKTSFF